MSAKTFEFLITPTDQTTDPYFYVPFEVPAGTTRIDVSLAYPKAEDCVIDLGVFDTRVTDYPSVDGFRGWSGGARDRFFIATDDATPGYVHGPIQPGIWKVVLGLYKLPADGATVTVSVAYDYASRAVQAQPARTFPVRQGAGWYKGDLHCHTFHSDAAGSPEQLHAQARQAGLDFLAVADHNTIAQRRYFHPQSSPDLVFVRAMEVTTAAGHANVYGVDEWLDFRMTRPSDAHILEKLVHERGGLLSINHDKPTIPWDYEMPAADCMEVWQSHWMAWNWVSLERYQQRLASGVRLSAIGGSDFHQPARLMPEGQLVLARPTTVLWLEELSEAAILEAMQTGHCYVTESPSGPSLVMSVDGHPMGSSLTEPGVVHIEVRGAKGDRVIWIDATGEIGSAPIEAEDWTYEFAVSSPIERFIRAEVIAEASRERLELEFLALLEGRDLPWQLKGVNIADQKIRRALGNPVYVERVAIPDKGL